MKKTLIAWCRSCHFDILIAAKESKGKRWMTVLNQIENEGNFNIDDFKTINDSWEKILETINSMCNKKINYLYHLKSNF